MVDTSTEAVTKLLDGVTPEPWGAESGHVQQNGQLYWQVTDKNHAIMQNQFCWCQGDHAANARFIAAARDLVPALLADRDALRAEVERLKAERDEAIEGWHVIHPNITVQDAARVPEIAAERDAYKLRGDNHWETMRCIYRIATVEGDIEAIIQHIKDAGQGYTERPEDTLRHYQTEVARLTSELAALRAISEGK